MDEKESKIIQEATRVFMTYGLKSVNMDDMARHLGISKKTLYLYVKNKEELVDKSLDYYCQSENKSIHAICQQGFNAIDESLEIMKWVLGILQNIHPSVTYDMEKYFPASFRKMKACRYSAIHDSLTYNMKKGQKEGFYRKDFDTSVITKLYFARIDLLFDQEVFPLSQYNITDIYKEMFRYHIRGIASAKGQSYLDEKLKTFKY
ncbi:MAG: TetR/AcrR family transcriptional regulator [Crocinitomicaceae bacterium]|nr:TetR/AcrR family transcriptional regulator [Crocinitomicaceae bacterium]